MDVLKKIKDDPDNPFGATIKANGQSFYDDPNGKFIDPLTGKKQSLSAIHKLKEEVNKSMTDIVKKELEQNIQELKHCVDKIVFYADTTEEIVKLNFESIRMMVDYCEQLSLEGEPAIERWLTSPRLAELKAVKKD